ncbi:MAG TPA: response regulator transcription factor [Baekduia sp.]|nr:response regulator transcription factor [Baekduia sp.]
MIRVLIADDHRLVRAGLEQLLQGSGEVEVVGSAAGGAEAVELDARTRPDVVLMDLSMPDLDGIDATRAILERRPGARVLVLTSFSERDRVLAALDAGAAGYLLKDAEPDELLRGIRAAAAGDAPLAPRAARALLEARREGAPPVADGGRTGLSPREREILDLLAEGLPNKLIALRLGIAEKTVKNHLSRIFQVLGVTDRTQAALAARRDEPGAR